MKNLFRLNFISTATLGLAAFSLPKSYKTEKTYGYVKVHQVKQDLWDHVSVSLVSTASSESPIYKSLCQKSHFDSYTPSHLDPSEFDNFSKFFLHLYHNLFKPILIGEPAAFEEDSSQMISQSFLIPVSKSEYQLALKYIRDMDHLVSEEKIAYVGLDKLRTSLSTSAYPFYNCATYVDGVLDSLKIPKSPISPLESFCTWPSTVIKRAESAAKSAPSRD